MDSNKAKRFYEEGMLERIRKKYCFNLNCFNRCKVNLFDLFASKLKWSEIIYTESYLATLLITDGINACLYTVLVPQT